MPWAAITDVDDLTGKDVSTAELAMAQAVIELHVARTDDTPTEALSARDLKWLKRAVAYQAAWMTEQPDIFTRTDMDENTALLQDGVDARNLPADAMTLAPLARRAVRRLSWKQSRSIHVESAFEQSARVYPVGGPVIDYPNEDWQPI